MAGNETVAVLEERVRRLEDKIFGPLPKDAEYPEVVSTLASLGGQLGSALGTRDRMMMVMKRLEELERYLDPSYGDSLELWDSVKVDLVLAREEQLRASHHHLNSITSLKHTLDSQHIADSASLREDLVAEWSKYSEVEAAAAAQSAQVRQMLHDYNQIINTLTETFIKMDEIVTKNEIAVLPKTSED